MPDHVLQLRCPEPEADHTIESEGVGVGPTKSAAVAAARTDADARLEIGVVCEGTCVLTREDVDPNWDSSRPTYKRWGNGYEAKIKRSKVIKAKCAPKPAGGERG